MHMESLFDVAIWVFGLLLITDGDADSLDTLFPLPHKLIIRIKKNVLSLRCNSINGDSFIKSDRIRTASDHLK